MPTSGDTAGGLGGSSITGDPIEGSVGGGSGGSASTASLPVVLVMFRPGGDTRSFSLFRDSTVIGRRQECDLRIPLGEVSRKHCRIVKEGGGVRVEDLGSSNGTYHNGKRVREADLSPGDALQIGPVSFVVQIAGEPDESAMRPPSAAADVKPSRKSAGGAIGSTPDPDALNPTAQSQAGDVEAEPPHADALAAVAGPGVGVTSGVTSGGTAGGTAGGAIPSPAIPSPSMSAFDLDPVDLDPVDLESDPADPDPADRDSADRDSDPDLGPVDSLSPLDALSADADLDADADAIPVAPVAPAGKPRPSPQPRPVKSGPVKPRPAPAPPAPAPPAPAASGEFDPMAVLAGDDDPDDLDAIDFGDLDDPADDRATGGSGDVIDFDPDDDPTTGGAKG